MTDEIRFAITALKNAGAREYASSGPSEEYHLYREAQARLNALVPDTDLLARYREALEKISGDQWEVISQSAGMRQFGPSQAAHIAMEALAEKDSNHG